MYDDALIISCRDPVNGSAAASTGTTLQFLLSFVRFSLELEKSHEKNIKNRGELPTHCEIHINLPHYSLLQLLT
jgi:hypothetical protein